MNFPDLPNEIILLVAESLIKEADISTLCRTNRHLYWLLSDFLHKNNIRRFHSEALFIGAKKGNLELVKRMVELGGDMQASLDGLFAVECAASQGHAEVVKYLLEKGAGYRYRKGQNWTPLFSAVTCGNADTVKVLLAHQEIGDQRVPVRKGDTPRGHLTMLEMMFKEMFDPDQPMSDRKTYEHSVALYLAITSGNDDTARALIADDRADLNYRDLSHRTPFMSVMSHGRFSLIAPLIEHGVDPNLLDLNFGMPPLILAVHEGRLDKVQMLLEHKQVDPNVQDSQGRWALHYVVTEPNIPLLKALLQRPDLDVNVQNLAGETPLLSCIANRYTEAATLLLQHPRMDHVDIPDLDGYTPLRYASLRGDAQITSLLLDKGASSTGSLMLGWPNPQPIFCTTDVNHVSAFKRLYQANPIDIDTRDATRQTMLFRAAYHGSIDIINLLVEMGASLDIPDFRGDTILLALLKRRPAAGGPGQGIRECDGEVIQMLVSRGADLNARDWNGRTTLDCALEYAAFDRGAVQKIFDAFGVQDPHAMVTGSRLERPLGGEGVVLGF